MVSTGSERLFHMAADQPFAQTHDHGLKGKLQADAHLVWSVQVRLTGLT